MFCIMGRPLNIIFDKRISNVLQSTNNDWSFGQWSRSRNNSKALAKRSNIVCQRFETYLSSEMVYRLTTPQNDPRQTIFYWRQAENFFELLLKRLTAHPAHLRFEVFCDVVKRLNILLDEQISKGGKTVFGQSGPGQAIKHCSSNICNFISIPFLTVWPKNKIHSLSFVKK